MNKFTNPDVKVKVIGVGGAGGNAVLRMANSNSSHNLDFSAINTDVQALNRINKILTLAIGPATTRGMGSGGNPEIGKKAIRESQEEIAHIIEDADMVFITAGMGGGTGTGGASIVAETAKKQGALTVAVVTLPFSFEGERRREIANSGIQQLRKKVDTLIIVENDKLVSSIDTELSLEMAFNIADEVLKQGIYGITEIFKMPGLINVDFADIKTVMSNGGQSFMAIGEGKGKNASSEAVQAVLANPLFNSPIKGAKHILFNIKGGIDLRMSQVHEIATVLKNATQSETHVIFGVVQCPELKKRVSITLVATGLMSEEEALPEIKYNPINEYLPYNTAIKMNSDQVKSPQLIHT